MPDLSIVITTYNRCDVLEQILHSLEGQTDRDFEVVVAVDGATDGTIEMLKKIETSYSLRWVDTEFSGYGLAVARNLGILQSEGRVVVIIDDDCFPSRDFVAEHRRSAKKGVITGGLRNPAESDNEYMVWKMAQLAKLPDCVPLSFPKLRKDWPNAYITECNMCLLREDFVNIGLFSERMKIYGFIGQEFFARAAYFGYEYQFNQTAAVVHRGNTAGNDGKARKRKMRQARLASLINPSLMTPRQFQAQARWAQARAHGDAAGPPMPPFLFDAIMKFPARGTYAVWKVAKRAIYARLRPDGFVLSLYRRAFRSRPD